VESPGKLAPQPYISATVEHTAQYVLLCESLFSFSHDLNFVLDLFSAFGFRLLLKIRNENLNCRSITLAYVVFLTCSELPTRYFYLDYV